MLPKSSICFELGWEEVEAYLFPLVGEETSGWPLAQVRVLHHSQWKWSVIRCRHLLCRGRQRSFIANGPIFNWRVALIYRCLGASTDYITPEPPGLISESPSLKMWLPVWPAKYHMPNLLHLLAPQAKCAANGGIFSGSAENIWRKYFQQKNKGTCLVIVSMISSSSFFLSFIRNN